ncbi:MAG TPA: hypothetical protein VGR47_23375 [Terracidiphilus sp.]|nr:hypothetical protein [Terracidiphilus sp.]
MDRTDQAAPPRHTMALLSRLLLQPDSKTGPSSTVARLKTQIECLRREDFENILTLSQSNHVIVRGLETFLDLARQAQDLERMDWAQEALAAERDRIAVAVHHLHEICSAFQENNLNVMVIKSLDHWPDLGSDLDLYTNAGPDEVIQLMRRRFGAEIAQRSWGDRLASKWNFMLPGLPEAVEIHVGRLGQTGEQQAFASSLLSRSIQVLRGGYSFRVPCASDRITISTMQRMYRHFYFRLCDVIDSAGLIDAGAVDFDDLLASAQAAGIWEGVATYLVIVSDYVNSYRGSNLDMPPFVAAAARFGGSEIYYGKGFLRVPILPQSARLYGSQLAGVLGRGEIDSGARLSLLPWLATAAVLGQKLTGSDKGIW